MRFPVKEGEREGGRQILVVIIFVKDVLPFLTEYVANKALSEGSVHTKIGGYRRYVRAGWRSRFNQSKERMTPFVRLAVDGDGKIAAYKRRSSLVSLILYCT